MAQVVLEVPDVSCEHCERTVRETLEPLEGVESVRVDIPGKAVTVQYDDRALSVGRMSEALAAEDYPVATSRPVGT
jgi:copper chaperone